MATSEEMKETVETLKGPRYYRIHLWGYGGESAYIKLDKKAFEFWENVIDSNGDYDAVNYMVNAEEGEFEFEDIQEVPAEADFMKDEDGDGRPWYEHHDEFCHQYGVEYGCARITVEEIDGIDYSSKVINEVLSSVELQEKLDEIMSEHNYEIELTEMGVAEGTDEQPDYVLQFYSAEKGTFYEGIIETVGNFDIMKLKVFTEEFPNGEDIITNITYEDKDVDNQGGDTNGKGYSVHVWKNV